MAFAKTSHSGTALWNVTKSAQRLVNAKICQWTKIMGLVVEDKEMSLTLKARQSSRREFKFVGDVKYVGDEALVPVDCQG